VRSRKGISKDLVAALLARLEPSLHFRFSLIALGRCEKMTARLRPARKQLARDAAHGQDVSNIDARRCLSPKTKAIAPRGFARCKPPALTPVPEPGNYGINEATEQEETKTIDDLVDTMHLNEIDLYAPLKDQPQLFPDRVHPNAEGAVARDNR